MEWERRLREIFCLKYASGSALVVTITMVIAIHEIGNFTGEIFGATKATVARESYHGENYGQNFGERYVESYCKSYDESYGGKIVK